MDNNEEDVIHEVTAMIAAFLMYFFIQVCGIFSLIIYNPYKINK